MARNALKHGLLSKEVLLESESPKDFELLLMTLKTALSPEGALEKLLADKVVWAAWRMQRLYQMEKSTLETLKSMLPEQPEVLEWSQDQKDCSLTESDRIAMEKALQEHILATAKDPHLCYLEIPDRVEPSEQSHQPLQLLARYGAAIDREFYRALHELQRIQAWRQGKSPPLPAAIDLQISDSN